MGHRNVEQAALFERLEAWGTDRGMVVKKGTEPLDRLMTAVSEWKNTAVDDFLSCHRRSIELMDPGFFERHELDLVDVGIRLNQLYSDEQERQGAQYTFNLAIAQIETLLHSEPPDGMGLEHMVGWLRLVLSGRADETRG